jgi:hypothetical protein
MELLILSNKAKINEFTRTIAVAGQLKEHILFT